MPHHIFPPVFRAHTLRLVADSGLLYAALGVAIGRGTDSPITFWDEGFLPARLHDLLVNTSVTRDGKQLPLVRREKLLLSSTEFLARDLAPDWLNDAVKGFLGGDDPTASVVLDVPGLRCFAASPRMLLALKVLAHRVGEDEDDVRLLAAALGMSTATEVLAVAEDVFGDRLEPAARFFVQELFAG